MTVDKPIIAPGTYWYQGERKQANLFLVLDIDVADSGVIAIGEQHVWRGPIEDFMASFSPLYPA